MAVHTVADGHETEARKRLLGGVSLVHVVPPSVVVTTGELVTKPLMAKHVVTVGHEMVLSAPNTPLGTVSLVHVVPPSVVVMMAPGLLDDPPTATHTVVDGHESW
jgi:hypothetical protein